MGLLDDAIREHLDLKRRSGADPADIERAEREALGPVRRGPEVAGEGEAPPEPVLEPEAEHLDSEEHLAPEPLATDPGPWERFEEDPELQEIEDHDELAPYEPAHGAGGDALLDDEPFREPEVERAPHPADLAEPPEAEPEAAEPPPAPAPVAPHLEQETEEYELEDEPEEDDDVLESTPEFLQDAPDHDRLWFEQRPPRDFDFDG
ncbi:MAG TPA: hypothetical protein VME22_09445 [Solirubrobacteraceae bacterium]|nr:hypothetical protein [Solirubrobacteraceae bacterium]